MNWEQLLSLKRFGDTHKRLRTEQDENRLGFEVDYDRIIFSKAFIQLPAASSSNMAAFNKPLAW